jgi:hypothetical protein
MHVCLFVYRLIEGIGLWFFVYDSGIYQLQCQTRFHKYIGQTGRIFHTRYTKRIQDIRNNRGYPGFHNIS